MDIDDEFSLLNEEGKLSPTRGRDIEQKRGLSIEFREDNLEENNPFSSELTNYSSKITNGKADQGLYGDELELEWNGEENLEDQIKKLSSFKNGGVPTLVSGSNGFHYDTPKIETTENPLQEPREVIEGIPKLDGMGDVCNFGGIYLQPNYANNESLDNGYQQFSSTHNFQPQQVEGGGNELNNSGFDDLHFYEEESHYEHVSKKRRANNNGEEMTPTRTPSGTPTRRKWGGKEPTREANNCNDNDSMEQQSFELNRSRNGEEDEYGADFDLKEVVESAKTSPKLKLANYGLEKIPGAIWKYTHLVELDLSANQLKRVGKELAFMTNLKLLALNHNCLSKLPNALWKLVSLKKLYLNNNNLKAIPNDIKNLSNLRVLDFCNNSIMELPNVITSLTSLVELKLRKNQIRQSKKIFNFFFFLMNLTIEENIKQ